MTKVTNFLSIALLVSMLAVVPAFAVGEDEAANNQPGFGTKVSNAVSTGVNWTCDKVGYVPNVVGDKFSELSPSTARLAKYALVTYLVASNPAVQGAVATLVATVQGVLGTAEDDADAEMGEPARLTIGKRA